MRRDAMTLGTCDLVIVVELYTDVVSNWYRAVAHGALSCRMKGNGACGVAARKTQIHVYRITNS
jgi:hypothetical protein